MRGKRNNDTTRSHEIFEKAMERSPEAQSIPCFVFWISIPIGSMYAIYGNIYHEYTPNVSIYTIHGSYGIWIDHLVVDHHP